VENRGSWALEAPPKRAKQMNARGLFIGWQDTVVRWVQVRPQITAGG
jgi:hypothetical protein